MKTKRILIILSLLTALFLITSQVIAAPSDSVVDKRSKTPPGQMRTPEAGETEDPLSDPGYLLGNPHGKNEHYKGVILSVDASSITLTLKDESTVTIGITEKTRIKVQGVHGATTAELLVGLTVTVQAVRGQDDSLTARAILVVPGKPAKMHNNGVVTAYSAGTSISIQAKDGEIYTYKLTADTRILPLERVELLVVGANVTVVVPRIPSAVDQVATAIIVHPVKAVETETP